MHKKSMFYWILIVLCVLLTVFGQIINKEGTFHGQAINVYYIIGYIFLFIRGFLWLFVVRKVPLSYAYPFMSLSFILILVGANFFFNEPVTLNKVVGCLLVITGVCLTSIKKFSREKVD